jgi:2-(1,2-epoxy-1,2-dihydrophenyl)acetyl-CoA isomerase
MGWSAVTASLSVDRGAHIARITLHGPDLDPATVRQLCGFLDAVEADDAVKVVVLTGDGPDLSRGWDPAAAWSMYVDAPGGATKKVPSQRARLIALDELWWGPRGLWSRLLHCRKVTVLGAHGTCHETGLYLTLCVDLVIAAADADFANPRWSVYGVDGDISLLIATVGLRRTKDMMFGAAHWDARHALEIGLVDWTVATEDLTAECDRVAAMCASIMRDGIVSEKYAVFASLAKLGIDHSFATATVVGASLTNIHFQPGEFNALREIRDHGPDGARAAARDWLGPNAKEPT